MKKEFITDSVATVTLIYTEHETSAGTEFVILHGVELGWMNANPYPLTDSHDRKHFEKLLTAKTGLDCYGTESEAEADLANWHEDYMEVVA